MTSIDLAPYSADLLRTIATQEGTTESKLVWEMCLAYGRAKLAASARSGQTWQSVFALYGAAPVPDPVGTEPHLQVVVRLSTRSGLTTDFQGVTVTACAHAPACGRLIGVTGYETDTVPIAGLDAWLRDRAERGAAAVREDEGDGVDVVAATAECTCLQGARGSNPVGEPAQPDDLIFLVGTDLAERYEALFQSWDFGTYPVQTLNDIDGVKALRWIGYSREDLCRCEGPHDDWSNCPDVNADLTFECDRGCVGGCDWVMYPQYSRAWLILHGTDIDLGPLEEDHTALLTDRLLPELRL